MTMTKKISRRVNGARVEEEVELTTDEIAEIESYQSPAIFKTLEEANTALVEWVDAFSARVTGSVPIDEKLSWDAKETAAKAVVADTANSEQLALITAEADITGETALILANAIIAKATVYRAVVARMAGLRRATIGLLAAADVKVDAYAYDKVLTASQQSAVSMATDLGISVE